MSSDYTVGDLVAESTTFKSGMVVETNNETNEAKVQFADGTSKWVSQGDLRAVLMEYGTNEEDTNDPQKWIIE